MKQVRPRTIDGYREKLNQLSVSSSNGCVEFSGQRNKKGYGKIKFFRRDVRAHRLAYELKFGPIPEGLYVLHRCDNPPCINVNHLFLGTARANAVDRMLKGRGNNQYTVVLTKEV
jgi:hypothetical protein